MYFEIAYSFIFIFLNVSLHIIANCIAAINTFIVLLARHIDVILFEIIFVIDESNSRLFSNIALDIQLSAVYFLC